MNSTVPSFKPIFVPHTTLYLSKLFNRPIGNPTELIHYSTAGHKLCHPSNGSLMWNRPFVLPTMLGWLGWKRKAGRSRK